jgi:hypothetical protein
LHLTCDVLVSIFFCFSKWVNLYRYAERSTPAWWQKLANQGIKHAASSSTSSGMPSGTSGIVVPRHAEMWSLREQYSAANRGGVLHVDSP